ncbi:MAG: aminopeptidase [Thermoplasmata archaeon]|nr:aminopeptidase [Thermoplasmata archaeon]
MPNAKKKSKKIEEVLLRKRESIWKKATKKDIDTFFKYAEGYKDFMKAAKTERETVAKVVELARTNGFREISEFKQIKPGDRFYEVNKDKMIILGVAGKKSIDEGLNIITAHLDSPRLDLKQLPLYEDGETEIALFKTHYYGGIKKYHWVAFPLAIHGVVYTKDGKKVSIEIGEKAGDPVFIIPDLLPHLARNVQGERKLFDGIKGEELNIIVGSIPVQDEDVKQKVKVAVLDYLNKNYGIVEEDFVSAELEAVPAVAPMDSGFDRSFVLAYGQDDRVCVYTALTALMELEKPDKWCLAVFYDKEEIGSAGNTSATSYFFENFVANLCMMCTEQHCGCDVKSVLERSKALSGDVDAGVDPTYKEVHDLNNAAKMGYGIVVTKYTGVGGKYSANDAHAEYMGKVRQIFNKAGVAWQSAELGKVDEGGGGTVAKYLAMYNMDIVDCGPAVLSMHAPLEITSKADLYHTHLAYLAFYENMD